MRRCLAALALVAAACNSTEAEKVDSTTAPAAAPTSTRVDEDSIRALSQRWLQAAASHDTAAIGALFADDGVTYPLMQPAARGPAAASASYGALYRLGKDVKLTFETTDLAVAASGDMAVERGTYRTTWLDKQGKTITDRGNFVTTWKKVNGQWKVYADAAVPEAPVPGM